MSKFDYDFFIGDDCDDYSVVVSKERYTEQEAVEIAKSELDVNEVEKRDGFVSYGYGFDEYGEVRYMWGLGWSEGKGCCPVWVFREQEG